MKDTCLGNRYLDPLRASKDDVAIAVEELLQEQRRTPSRRELPRYQFNARVDIHIDLHQPGGSISRLVVRAQDMNKKGLGFLNGGFVYPGSVCKMSLTTLGGEKLQIRGVVKHCRCIRGKVHYVGVQFESDIDPAIFIEDAVPAKPQVIEDPPDPDAVANLSRQLHEMALLSSPIGELHDLYRELGTALGFPFNRET